MNGTIQTEGMTQRTIPCPPVINIYIKHEHQFLSEQSTSKLTSTSRSNKANKRTHRQPTTIQQSNKPTKKPQATRNKLVTFFDLNWSFQFGCWCHHVSCGEIFICSSLVIATTINNITTRNARITTTSNNHYHIDKRG